jgi:hypothetical protein
MFQKFFLINENGRSFPFFEKINKTQYMLIAEINSAVFAKWTLNKLNIYLLPKNECQGNLDETINFSYSRNFPIATKCRCTRQGA